MNFAEKIIKFNRQLKFTGSLPNGIAVMNPFKENASAISASTAFYQKYYNDNNKRFWILGINPGRFGAGVTGIPFTDTKRLQEVCGIILNNKQTHEPSSVFIYEMIAAYGGAAKFYSKFYINSVCPLGFTNNNDKHNNINYNYYDNAELLKASEPFIISSLQQQIKFGIYTHIGFCMGTGKNFSYLQKLNAKHGFFQQIIPLEHPRFIIQYKQRSKEVYIEKYVKAFNNVLL